MKIALVLHSGAGTLRDQDANAFAAKIAAIFTAHGHAVETTVAAGGDAVAAIRRIASARAVDAIVAGGGDGTISAAAAACADSGVALGVLPLGTMNLFARSLKIPLAVEPAAEALAGGRIAAADIARVNGRIFVHALTLGFHATLVEEREKTPTYRSRIEKMIGSARSWWLVIRQPRRLSLTIRTDHQTLERQTIGLVVTNNVFGAGHLPYADALDTGLLGIYVARGESPAEIVRITAEAAVGLVSKSPLIEHLTSQAVDIRPGKRHIKATVDGELVRLAAPIRVESVPGGLKVLVPAASAAG
jgi:diacylglycerol kinase family enzyme